ncbi:hypothetical protein GP486_007310 [Trichoglossum hirsutum]|uniref:Uncharacterized protein n=1 Tax=Trichoglossum hirsutum TaxID=265104 RepID=A0A9P8L6Y0_9PEZI|nr:hypothetical protein GP486_007310 [Trichoglossum hirsutum]
MALNDRSQYKQFFEEKNFGVPRIPSQPRVSFPISSSSTEAEIFSKVLPEVKKCLRDQAFNWESITCVGRSSYGTDEPIVSTIIITSKDPASEDFIGNIKKEGKSVWGLPVEFLTGTLEDLTSTSRFGFRERNNPIVCGSSCASLRYGEISGTLGGFITLKNEPSNAVYAISNHHVFRPKNDKPVNWRDDSELESELQGLELTRSFQRVAAESFNKLKKECDKYERIGKILRARGIENFWRGEIIDRLEDELGPKEFGEIFRLHEPKKVEIISQILRNETVKILAFLSDFCNLVTRYRLEGYDACFPTFQRALHELQPPRLELSRLELSRLEPPRLEPSRLDRLEPAGPGHFDQECRIYEDPLGERLRDLCDQWFITMEKREDFLIEHPSKRDRDYIVTKLMRDLKESQILLGNPQTVKGTSQGAIQSIKEASRRDTEYLEGNLEKAKDINYNNIMASVRVSSGKRPKKVDPYHGKEIFEDWAIAKLIPGITVENTIGGNILRLNDTTTENQRILGVRSWRNKMSFDRLPVFKRGRTTACTVGYVNGVRSVIKDETEEYVIVSTAPTGRFAVKGDSGSWIVDRQGLLVGMLWGVAPEGSAIFTPAEYLFKFIGSKIREDLNEDNEDNFIPAIY